MKIKAIFPPLYADRMESGTLVGRPPEPDAQREFEWDAPGPTVEEALEQAYREFNVVQDDDSHIERRCRSMSVGDVVLVGGKYMAAAPAGWEEITKAEFDQWRELPFSDRLMGVEWARKKGLVKNA